MDISYFRVIKRMRLYPWPTGRKPALNSEVRLKRTEVRMCERGIYDAQ